MKSCFIRGISVFGPGLAAWPQARAVLRGEAPFTGDIVPPPPPGLLAPNERRRTGLPTRLAFAVCQEAVLMSGLAADSLACVFASANGEGAVTHGLLETLAGPDRQVSPTQFHNSVHNAVSGYWSIGTKSMQPVTCLAAGDTSFAAALMQAVAAAGNVLLCVYDAPIPSPLGDGRITAFAFASAFVLSADAHGALAEIQLRTGGTAGDCLPRGPALRALVEGNAAARALRLAEAVASESRDSFSLELADGWLTVDVLVLP